MGCISLQFAGLQVSQHYYYGYGNRLLAKWRKIRNRISQHWHFPILFFLSLCPHVASFICLGFKEKLLETMVPSPNILGFPSIHPSKRQPQAEVFGEDSEVRSDFQTFLILTVLGKRFRSTPSTGKSPNYQGCLGREGLGSGMGQLLHGTAALLSEALHGEVCG